MRGYYSRAALISLSSRKARLLFEGGYYSGCGYYSSKYGTYIHTNYLRDAKRNYSAAAFAWQKTAHSVLHPEFSRARVMGMHYAASNTNKKVNNLMEYR